MHGYMWPGLGVCWACKGHGCPLSRTRVASHGENPQASQRAFFGGHCPPSDGHCPLSGGKSWTSQWHLQNQKNPHIQCGAHLLFPWVKCCVFGYLCPWADSGKFLTQSWSLKTAANLPVSQQGTALHNDGEAIICCREVYVLCKKGCTITCIAVKHIVVVKCLVWCWF